MKLELRVAKIEAGIDVANLSPEQVTRLDVMKLTRKQIQALNVDYLTEAQLMAINMAYLTNEQLEVIAAPCSPAVEQWIEGLSNEELKAVSEGRLGPPEWVRQSKTT